MAERRQDNALRKLCYLFLRYFFFNRFYPGFRVNGREGKKNDENGDPQMPFHLLSP